MLKKRITIIIALVGVLLISVVGTSFALFEKTATQTGENTITTLNCLDVSISGGTEITLNAAYPIKDGEGVLQTPYTFTITNNCTQFVGVKLGVEFEDDTSDIDASYIKAVINKPSEGMMPRLLTDYELIQATDSETGLPTEKAKYMMAYEGLPAGDTQTFEYRMWIDYNTTNLNNNDKVNVKLVAIATAKTEDAAPKTWWTANQIDGSTTLLRALRNNNTIKVPLTTPGAQVTLGTEYAADEHTMEINSTYQNYYFTYGTGYTQNANGTFNLTGVNNLLYKNNYQDLVGKYIVSSSLGTTTSSSPANKASSNLTDLLYVVKATSHSLTFIGYNSLTTNEAELASTNDDYGTSYYFRGNVQNNFVVFAKRCWKIVRIDGKGNIKLILWNKDGKDCTISTQQGQAFNNGKYTKEDSDTQYNMWGSASGVGFMYGEPDSKQIDVYAEGGAQENKYDSSMLTYLKGWYENTFNVKDNTLTSNYTEMLADVIWCGDKSFYSGPGYAESGDTDKINTYFNAYKRLTQNSTSPSLVCPSTSIVAGETVNIGNISKYTAADTKNGNGLLKKEMGTNPETGEKIYKLYKVGLITVDEAAFAGGANNKPNSTYYLYTNSYYWIMSPSFFNGTYAHVFNVGSVGSLVGNYVGNDAGARPAVSLKSDVTITKGNGTINNPYVIKVDEI